MVDVRISTNVVSKVSEAIDKLPQVKLELSRETVELSAASTESPGTGEKASEAPVELPAPILATSGSGVGVYNIKTESTDATAGFSRFREDTSTRAGTVVVSLVNGVL